MLIYVSLKKKRSNIKKSFKVSLGETSAGVLKRWNSMKSPVPRHLRRVIFFSTYRICYPIPHYYPRILFHRYNGAIVVLTSDKIHVYVGRDEEYPATLPRRSGQWNLQLTTFVHDLPTESAFYPRGFFFFFFFFFFCYFKGVNISWFDV